MNSTCRTILALVVIVGALAMMASLPPLADWRVGQACGGGFNSLFNQTWCWFAFNKDAIAPVVQLLGVAGIVVAAISFFRTQQLNQATAVFQMMKEGRDLQLKLNPPPAAAATTTPATTTPTATAPTTTTPTTTTPTTTTPTTTSGATTTAAQKSLAIKLGTNFHASIFQYRLHKFIDSTTWKPFEDDLEGAMRDADFVDWLYGGSNVYGLPRIDHLDPRFVAYLKSIHRRVTGP